MSILHVLSVTPSAALRPTCSLRAMVLFLLLLPVIALADDQRAAIDALLDGLHQDANNGSFKTYFDRYTPNAVFLGTDKSERWNIKEFKAYAAPAFADGHGWTYSVQERHLEGVGNTRWFDEILLNKKLGHCRGTGVVELIDGEWKIAHYALTMLIPNDIAADVGQQTRLADGILYK